MQARPDTAIVDGASMWTLSAAPTVWAVHFLACYALAAVWCARAGRSAPLGEARGWIGVLTLGALVLLGWLGLRAWRRARAACAVQHALDSTRARDRFMAWIALLLALLAALAVLYAAAAAVLIGTCA